MATHVNVIPRSAVHIEDAPRMILRNGTEIAWMLVGQPGTAKTSIQAAIAEMVGDKWRRRGDYFPEDKYDYIVMLGPQLDVQAFGTVVPDMQRKIVEQYLGGMLNPHDPRPKIIFIDEIGKCPKILKPVLRDLLLERVTPGFRLPEGSIVYAATNNPADGLGDVIAAHEGNAMTILPVLPPRLPYWLLKWAPANGISDLTCTVLQQNPQMWASYMVEDVTNNPLVFDPKRRAYSFCSPRSLTKNDRGFVQNRGFFTRDELYAGMAGTIGQAAADIFMVYIDMEKDTVDPHLIRSSPLTAPIPESAGTKIFTLFKLTPVIETQEDLANVMTYLERWNQREFEATFFQIVSNNPKTAPLVIRNPKMLEWRNDNHGLIGNIR